MSYNDFHQYANLPLKHRSDRTAHTHCCSTPTRNSISHSMKTSPSCCSTDPRPEPRMTNARSCSKRRWMTNARNCCSILQSCSKRRWMTSAPSCLTSVQRWKKRTSRWTKSSTLPSCCWHHRSPRRRSTRSHPRAARNCSRRHHRRQALKSMQEQTQDAQILACTRMTAEMRLPHDQMVLF